MKFNSYILTVTFILASLNLFSQDKNPAIYLLPGQGADERLFSKLEFPNHKVIDIQYPIPSDKIQMAGYAKILSAQIDTTEKFILIGASLGGMLSSEMIEFISPEKVIIISSAKHPSELPGRYKFQKKIPIYKLIGGKMSKLGAKIMQPIVEPDRRHEKEIFKAMLRDKDEKFMQNSIRLIMEWEKENYNESIIHIHGDNDHTIPVKNVDYDYLIKDGSHMMSLTRAKDINELLIKILQENN